jgi:flagella basal body P-ring formation protein FlgA
VATVSEKIMRKQNRRAMMRHALAILLFACAAAPAAAQVTGSVTPMNARLKTEATVSGDIVRIGDLVENAGLAANTPIFRAPDLGQTGAVPVRRVLDAVLPHGLIAVDTRGISEVAVTRASRAIAAEDIEARIVRALTARYNLGKAENVKITFDRDVRAIQLDASVTADLALARMSYDAPSRRFDATFELNTGGRAQWRYTGQAVETIEAAVPTRALARGEVVKANDFTIERRPKAEFLSEPPAPASDVVGLAARRSVRAGAPLRGADLMKPEMVARGDMVTLHYAVPGIVLSMRGKALEAGAEGDSVSVLNEQSKRTIQGTVTAPGHVTVMSASPPRVAARAAEPADESAEQTRSTE